MTDHASPAIPQAKGWLFSPAATSKVRRLTGDDSAVWIGYRLGVISSAGDMDYHGLIVPHNHVSVTRHPTTRPTNAELDRVRSDFDMLDAEEDNHLPGVARHLFLPLHLPRGTAGICECKTDEELVTERDGFVWSRPKAAQSGQPDG